MTYIDYLNDFNRWLESNRLPASSQLLYFKILDVFNRTGWQTLVQVDNRRIMIMAEVSTEKTAIRARDALIAAGFITYQKGKKGAPGRYSLCHLYCNDYSKYYSISDSKNDSVYDSESDSKNDSHIKTKTKNKTKSLSPPIPPSRGDTPPKSEAAEIVDASNLSATVKAKLHEWLTYKGKSAYKPVGAQALIARITKYVDTYGADAVCNLVDECMANGYKGIIFDRLDKNAVREKYHAKQDDGGSFDTDEFFAAAVARGRKGEEI